MGTRFLIDTNILIYYFENRLLKASAKITDSIFRESFCISVISKIEFLGWHGYSGPKYRLAEEILQKATIFDLNEEIVDETIRLRKRLKIKIPDAIIAATSLVHERTLVTRNIGDFVGIPSLQLLNPFVARP